MHLAGEKPTLSQPDLMRWHLTHWHLTRWLLLTAVIAALAGIYGLASRDPEVVAGQALVGDLSGADTIVITVQSPFEYRVVLRRLTLVRSEDSLADGFQKMWVLGYLDGLKATTQVDVSNTPARQFLRSLNQVDLLDAEYVAPVARAPAHAVRLPVELSIVVRAKEREVRFHALSGEAWGDPWAVDVGERTWPVANDVIGRAMYSLVRSVDPAWVESWSEVLEGRTEFTIDDVRPPVAGAP